MKIKMMILVFCLVAIASLFGVSKTRADGGIFYPPDYYSSETTQKAFIYFANQTENLVVLASYRGNAKDFAWVIPTPSKPEINKGNVSLFNSLTKITKTTNNGPDIVYDKSFGLGGSPESSPVEVISEKTIDVYDTVVLKATDENALAKWLSDHGYSFPQDKSQSLKSYVENGWYFAIAKIKPDLIGGGGIENQLSKGMLTPLRLTFKSDKIIYPMKLTGIALSQDIPASITGATDESSGEQTSPLPNNIPITLYVLSDQKTEQKQLSTDWANWIDQTNIKELNDDLSANIISGQKLFLTKMNDSVNVTDINDDFIITATSDNQVYPTPSYKTTGFWLENLLFLILVPIMVIFVPIPLGLIFIVFILLQFYLRKKWLYIIGNIYQILICLILLITDLIILAGNSFNISDLLLQSGFIGGAISLLALEILSIYITIKMIKRYKTVFHKE